MGRTLGPGAARAAGADASPRAASSVGAPAADFPLGEGAGEGVGEAPSRYRVHLLPEAKVTERGILYRRGSERFLLAWGRVRHALAAEVGEPEGVCTVVFDLVLEPCGDAWVVARFDADPGEQAARVAKAIALGAGRERCSPALRALATDGVVTRWYPDLETLEQAALEYLRFR